MKAVGLGRESRPSSTQLSSLISQSSQTSVQQRLANSSLWAISPPSCFQTACGLRMLSTFLNGWEIIKSRILFHDMRKSYEVQISELTSRAVVGTSPRSLPDVLSTAASELWQSGGVVLQQRLCGLQSQKYGPSGPLHKKFADP